MLYEVITYLRVENTHDRFLAKGHWNSRDTDLGIRLLLTTADLDTPVLGAALFGDIEPGQAFNSRGDGGMHRLGQLVDGVEDTVDTEPHHTDIALGLDMDIRGALIQGITEQMIDRRLDVLIRGTQFPG